MCIGVGEQGGVDAVESVGPVQVLPAAGCLIVVLVPMLISYPRGGVVGRLLHAAPVLLNSVKRG